MQKSERNPRVGHARLIAEGQMGDDRLILGRGGREAGESPVSLVRGHDVHHATMGRPCRRESGPRSGVTPHGAISVTVGRPVRLRVVAHREGIVRAAAREAVERLGSTPVWRHPACQLLRFG